MYGKKQEFVIALRDTTELKNLLINTWSHGSSATLTSTDSSISWKQMLDWQSFLSEYWANKIYPLSCTCKSAKAAQGQQGWFYLLFWETAVLFIFNGSSQLEHLEQSFLWFMFTFSFNKSSNIFLYQRQANAWYLGEAKMMNSPLMLILKRILKWVNTALIFCQQSS